MNKCAKKNWSTWNKWIEVPKQISKIPKKDPKCQDSNMDSHIKEPRPDAQTHKQPRTQKSTFIQANTTIKITGN